MAFRQHAPQRIHTSTTQASAAQPQEQISQPIEEPQEWVLFSPISVSDRTQTGTSTTTQGVRFTRTPGRSRIADYSSLGYDDEDGEDEELDSLDSHLPAFRADHSVYRNSGNENGAQNDASTSGPVLPTHDGLGSFRVDSSQGIQEHLYAFEQYNPRRVKRRRESLELGEAAFREEIDLENQRDSEKTRWIEEWRMEQSRFLLEEIQRETRRRRKQSMSNASQQVGIKSRRPSVLDDDENVETATLGGYDSTEIGSQVENRNSDEHEGDGFWKRLTQTVIRDLMGIDDRLLAILFGEALPELSEDDDLSTTPPANPSSLEHISQLHDSTWEHRLLDRIAREFGILVNQLTDHPGAFSTYVRTRARERQISLPYTSLPVIPEFATTASREITQSSHREQTIDRRPSTTTQTDNDFNTFTFQPTLQSTTQPITISNPISPSNITPNQPQTPDLHRPPNNNVDDLTTEREYWERELDIKMVFRYLRSRFSNTDTASSSTTNSDLTSSNVQEAEASVMAARAARVRFYHPLVRARTLSTSSPNIASGVVAATPSFVGRSSIGRDGGVGVGVSRSGRGRSLGGRSLSESCKSQSARRSSGISRNYWGGAGSSLSGSMGISTGGMGAWGEV